MAVDGGGLSQQYSAESRNKENMKRPLHPILGTWATRSEYSQICGFRGTFEILPSAVDNGFLGRGMNADCVSGFQELCDRPREAGHSSSLSASRRDSRQEGQGHLDGFTSMMGLDARTFSSMLVSLAEPLTVAK